MNSPSEQDLSAAFRDLVAEQPFTPDVSAIEQRARRTRRRARFTQGGIGAGAVVLAAAAVGVASALPSAPSGRAQSSGARPATASARPAKTGAPADSQAQLMTLTAALAAEAKQSGDATLVERETSYPGKASINVWDLYTDDGQYFFSRTKAGLPAQVTENNNQANGQFGREVAAAKYAVTGNLETAALKMAWAADTTAVPSWLSAQVKDMSAGNLQIDNYVWENCQDALIAGSGNPQVRAGVLRLVSALPALTVTHGTADGQPTLTLTAGAAEFPNPAAVKASPKAQKLPAYQEAITINADTGVPLKFVGGPTGKVAVTVTYAVTRTSLAGIAAGKF